MLGACGEIETPVACPGEYTSTTEGAELALKDPSVHGGNELAQSFQLREKDDPNDTTDWSISVVRLNLFREGSFDAEDTVTVEIQPDSNGKPTNDSPPLATASVKISNLSNTPSLEAFQFDTPASLAPETTYWIRLSSSYEQSATDFVKWTAHSGSDGEYEHGKALLEESVSEDWQDTSIGAFRDFNFKIGC